MDTVDGQVEGGETAGQEATPPPIIVLDIGIYSRARYKLIRGLDKVRSKKFLPTLPDIGSYKLEEGEGRESIFVFNQD